MSLININPTTTDNWKNLNNHFKKTQSVHMKSLFQNDPNRKENLKEDYFVYIAPLKSQIDSIPTSFLEKAVIRNVSP